MIFIKISFGKKIIYLLINLKLIIDKKRNIFLAYKMEKF